MKQAAHNSSARQADLIQHQAFARTHLQWVAIRNSASSYLLSSYYKEYFSFHSSAFVVQRKRFISFHLGGNQHGNERSMER